MTDIVSDDRPVAAVGDIYTMLIIRGQAFIVFNEYVICETGKDPAFEIAFTVIVSDDAIIRIDEPDPVAGHVDDPETIDLYIVGIFHIDPIRRSGGRIDDHIISCGDKDDRVSSGACDADIKPCIGDISHPNCITGCNMIFCPLQRCPCLIPGIS